MRSTDPRFAEHQALIDRALRLCRRRRWPIDLDDARQAALLGLYQACQRLPPEAVEAVGFERFAWTRVKGAVLDEARRQGMRRSRALIDRDDFSAAAAAARATGQQPEVAFDQEGELTEIIAPGPSPEQALLERETHQQLRHRLSRLPPRHAELILHLLRGGAQYELARQWNISVPRISQLYTAAIKRARALGDLVSRQQEIEEATLRHLAIPGAHSTSSIAKRFGITPQAASARLKRLRADGLVHAGSRDYRLTSRGLLRLGLTAEEEAPPPPPAPLPPPTPAPSALPAPLDVEAIVRTVLTDASARLAARVVELEEEVAQLRAQIARARLALGEDA